VSQSLKSGVPANLCAVSTTKRSLTRARKLVIPIGGEEMPAYLVAEIKILDQVKYQAYHPLAAAAIAHHGGRVVAGTRVVVGLENVDAQSRWVIVEFDSLPQGRKFFESAEYQSAIAAREDAAIVRMVLLDGN